MDPNEAFRRAVQERMGSNTVQQSQSNFGFQQLSAPYMTNTVYPDFSVPPPIISEPSNGKITGDLFNQGVYQRLSPPTSPPSSTCRVSPYFIPSEVPPMRSYRPPTSGPMTSNCYPIHGNVRPLRPLFTPIHLPPPGFGFQLQSSPGFVTSPQFACPPLPNSIIPPLSSHVGHQSLSSVGFEHWPDPSADMETKHCSRRFEGIDRLWKPISRQKQFPDRSPVRPEDFPDLPPVVSQPCPPLIPLFPEDMTKSNESTDSNDTLDCVLLGVPEVLRVKKPSPTSKVEDVQEVKCDHKVSAMKSENDDVERARSRAKDRHREKREDPFASTQDEKKIQPTRWDHVSDAWDDLDEQTIELNQADPSKLCLVSDEYESSRKVSEDSGSEGQGTNESDGDEASSVEGYESDDLLSDLSDQSHHFLCSDGEQYPKLQEKIDVLGGINFKQYCAQLIISRAKIYVSGVVKETNGDEVQFEFGTYWAPDLPLIAMLEKAFDEQKLFNDRNLMVRAMCYRQLSENVIVESSVWLPTTPEASYVVKMKRRP